MIADITSSPKAAVRVVMTRSALCSTLSRSTGLAIRSSRALDALQPVALQVIEQCTMGREPGQHRLRECRRLPEIPLRQRRIVRPLRECRRFGPKAHPVQHVMVACRGEDLLDAEKIVAGGRLLT